MNYSLEEIMQYIEEEDAKFIRLAFRDVFGVQKNVSVMPDELAKAFEEGIAINASAIAGFESSGYANLYLRPDASTLTVLPWRPDRGRVLRMICDVYTPSGELFECDTRALLKKAVGEAEAAGISFMIGSESEFYLFKKDEDGNPTDIPYDEAGYLDIAPLDRGENIRREIVLTIEEMGLKPERSHHERGPGQNEIDFHYGEPLTAADHAITYKMAVDTIADRNGLKADFSPMPLDGKPGNGYHINIYAADRDGRDVCRYAAAGIINRIRDITLFLNPSDDSYSRFGMSTAPNRISWSSDLDSELISVTAYRNMIRTELRSPDAMSNPYLAYALIIFAGLEGIRSQMELPIEKDPDGALLPQSRAESRMVAGESSFVADCIPAGIIKAYLR
ncbi:MAG: glutamine synthetase [Lachnospiraceae bacterium]|nr:glutamine synthetase [Lachnospiraceae bacterium]